MEKINRVKELVSELRTFSTPELCDGGASLVMDYQMKPLACARKIVGPAYTVKVPENVSGIIPDAFADIKAGEVLVVEGHGSCVGSYWGDYRSLCARKLGVEGVVIDGAFRDYEECEKIGVPIYAKGIIPKSAGKERKGELQVPVVCAGIVVRPGDMIMGDGSGVLVIRPEEAEQIMAGARRKREAEERTLQEMEKTKVVIPRVKL